MGDPIIRLGLDPIGTADIPRAGRKTAALGALLEAGFPVPPGVCIATQVFHQAIAPFRAGMRAILNAAPLHHPQGALQAAQAIGRLLAGLALPEGLLEAVERALAEVVVAAGLAAGPGEARPGGGQPGNGLPLAVRSSATAEDRPEASFAGQYHSALGVRSREALGDAILEVWRSFYSPAALAARRAVEAPEGEEGMAVLIQPLLEAECAGVCFSVDPASPPPHDRMLVVATWGLGAGVADGSLPADSAWLRRADSSIAERQVAVKNEQYLPGEEGQLRLFPVAPEKRRAACLPDEWLARIGQFALAAEQLFGQPQDVEWAITALGDRSADGGPGDGGTEAGRRLWVLQSRPVASLPPELAHTAPFPVEWPEEAHRRRSWQLYRIDGRGDEPLLPLERDFIAAWESTRLDTTRFLGVERHQDMRVFNGRVYFSPAPTGLSEADRGVRRRAAADLKERLFQQGQTLWDHWGPEIVRAGERLQAFRPEGATDEALADHLEHALAALRRHTMIHPMLDFKPRPAYFAAYGALTGRSGVEAEAAAYRLVEAEETVLTRLVDDLYGLAQAARGEPALEALLRSLEEALSPQEAQRLEGDLLPQGDLPPQPQALLAGLARLPGAGVLRQRLEAFLDAYGARTGEGYGSQQHLFAPTWAEQPQEVLRLAGVYLDSQVKPPAEARRQARQRRDAEVEAMCAAGDSYAAAEFRREWAYALQTMKVLEEHNHYIDQLSTGLLRLAALAAAGRLAERGVLEQPQDVFYLTFAEIGSALRGRAAGALAGLVAQRKGEQAAWAALHPPGFLGLPDPRLPERPPLGDEVQAREAPVEGQNDGRVVGRGVSPGQCAGRARVVLNLVSHPDIQPGEILVAPNAGPLWLPFFPVLGGLVLDGGSLGQHAASTAREYGIPAVVETQIATQVIPDGAWVEVDGTQGTVSVVSGKRQMASDV